MNLIAELQWIRHQYGGRSIAPEKGSKHGLRIQRYVSEWIKFYMEVEIIFVEFDRNSWTGTAHLKVSDGSIEELVKFTDEKNIELLDGYKVIAIGIVKEYIN